MEQNFTPSGISYMSYTDGKLTRFELYPIIDKDTQTKVDQSIGWIKHKQQFDSCKTIQIRWITGSDKCMDLLKIPDHLIIKSMRVEIGKLTSYIEELEEGNKELNKKIKDQNVQHQKELDECKKMSHEERMEVHKETLYIEQKLKIKGLETSVKSLKTIRDELLIKLYQHPKKIQE